MSAAEGQYPTVAVVPWTALVRHPEDSSMGSWSDVNGDGWPDLVCHFHTPTAAFQAGDTEGVLKGQTVAAVPFSGSDSVRIVPPR